MYWPSSRVRTRHLLNEFFPIAGRRVHLHNRPSGLSESIPTSAGSVFPPHGDLSGFSQLRGIKSASAFRLFLLRFFRARFSPFSVGQADIQFSVPIPCRSRVRVTPRGSSIGEIEQRRAEIAFPAAAHPLAAHSERKTPLCSRLAPGVMIDSRILQNMCGQSIHMLLSRVPVRQCDKQQDRPQSLPARKRSRRGPLSAAFPAFLRCAMIFSAVFRCVKWNRFGGSS